MEEEEKKSSLEERKRNQTLARAMAEEERARRTRYIRIYFFVFYKHLFFVFDIIFYNPFLKRTVDMLYVLCSNISSTCMYIIHSK